MDAYMNQAEANLLHVYNRFPVVFDRGEGVYLYDTDNKKYLDFAAGIAVMALGYGNKEYSEALKEQVDKLLHTSNYYYNVPAAEAAKKLTAVSGMSRVFFTNSGAEAIEGAMKAARKYAYLRDGHTNHEIIAMEHSFHGRTMGALSVTGTTKYREPFEPLPGVVAFADYNDLDSIKALANEKTCAIILEPVQGEGGIFPGTKEFLAGVKKLCEEKDILLIFDEIQCGMGRTGTMFAWQKYGIKPNIMTSAKALGCGVPVGAFLVDEKVAKASLEPGDHGSTYGGNPFVCAAVSKVLDIYEKDNILAHVQEVGEYLEKQLDKLADEQEEIVERRGCGLMQGLVFDRPVAPILQEALKEGLVLINAGTNIIRLVPPLVIETDHIDEMIGKLKKCLKK